jgi:NTE family protein
MLQALSARAIVPDLLVGTSAGAVNAAFVAGHGTGGDALGYLARTWEGLRPQDVFPFDLLRSARALTGSKTALCSSAPLGRVLAANIPYRRLEDAPTPVHIVAPNLLSGEEVLLSTGDTVSAVLASCAIPGILPPVERDGLVLVDGGVADNAALSQAVTLGADEIYVLAAGFACSLEAPPRRALGVALQSLTLLIEQRLVMEVAQFSGHAQVKVLPPLCPLEVASADFRHARELIERSRDATGRWIDSGGPDLPAPARFLSLHHHTGEC